MCAIIDNDVVAEAFGDQPTPAGRAFRQSVDQGRIQLVVGGELLDELDQNRNFRKWRAVAMHYGKVFSPERNKVDLQTKQLRTKAKLCFKRRAHYRARANHRSTAIIWQ